MAGKTLTVEPSFEGKHILLTGASGYIAHNLIEALKNVACTIVRLDRKPPLERVEGIANIVDIAGDVRDKSIFGRVLEDVDIVFHLAGQTSLYWAEENPLEDYGINVVPMMDLLETCRRRGRKPIIIFSGTATEAGVPKRVPVNEAFRDRPASIYDFHKLMAENYLLYYARKGVVRGTSLRLANVYGPGPESGSRDRGVLNMMIRRALGNEGLNIYGTGEYLRDYIHVEDVVQAFLKAAVQADKVNGRYFLVGSGVGKTIQQAVTLVAERVAAKTGVKAAVRHVDPPTPLHPVEFRNFIADSRRLIRAVDFKISYSLIEGIDQTIDSFRRSRISPIGHGKEMGSAIRWRKQ